MGYGKCVKLIRIIPDRLGYRIEEMVPSRDWTLSGYTGRVVGRVWSR